MKRFYFVVNNLNRHIADNNNKIRIIRVRDKENYSRRNDEDNTLSDLHFGKSVHGVSMLENGDQGYWVDRFLEFVEEEHPDVVLIAGDVYDRSAPSGEAVTLLSRFLTGLSQRKIPVMMVAGNHDSVQRLSFLKSLLARQGVYISGSLTSEKEITHVTLQDEYGDVVFWLMPYAFPALVAEALRKDDADWGEEAPEVKINEISNRSKTNEDEETTRHFSDKNDGSFSLDYFRNTEEAVRTLLEQQPIDFSKRNVLVAHQNVTAYGVEMIPGGSESMVGGAGQIDYKVFDGFDYVALGHIHAAYPVGRKEVRYAKSPLCYHFNETKQKAKGPVIVEITEKGGPIRIETKIIPPLHPMREIKGTYADLMESELNEQRTGEYVRVVITDRRISPEISAFFRSICEKRDSILMDINSEYSSDHGEPGVLTSTAVEEKTVEELFEDFYVERFFGEQPDEKDLSILQLAAGQLRFADIHSSPTAQHIDSFLKELISHI